MGDLPGKVVKEVRGGKKASNKTVFKENLRSLLDAAVTQFVLPLNALLHSANFCQKVVKEPVRHYIKAKGGSPGATLSPPGSESL